MIITIIIKLIIQIIVLLLLLVRKKQKLKQRQKMCIMKYAFGFPQKLYKRVIVTIMIVLQKQKSYYINIV